MAVDWLPDNFGPWDLLMDLIGQDDYKLSNLFHSGLDAVDPELAPKLGVMARALPLYGDVLSARDNVNYIQDYLDNTGQNWSDIKYPGRINLGLNAVVRQGTNFVSDNIKHLYD